MKMEDGKYPLFLGSLLQSIECPKCLHGNDLPSLNLSSLSFRSDRIFDDDFPNKIFQMVEKYRYVLVSGIVVGEMTLR
jgi:hypothetical protein